MRDDSDVGLVRRLNRSARIVAQAPTDADPRHYDLERTLSRIRALRDRLNAMFGRHHADRRRAEDRYRQEHQDAHALTVIGTLPRPRLHRRKPTSAIAGSRNSETFHAYSTGLPNLVMRVRIVKALPAPLMDGFDVSRFRVDHIYEVDSRTANYLIVAGYAVAAGEDGESIGR